MATGQPTSVPDLRPISEIGDERFRLLVDSVQDYAIFMLDPDGTVRTWNTGAERLKGYKAHEIIGQHFATFYPDEAVTRGWPAEELRRATSLGRFEDEGWRIRKDGQRFWASVVITALRDSAGRLQGFAKVTRDLSERRRHEEELRQSEAQLRLLVDAVDDCAIFMLSPTGEVLTWNAGAERIKGYAAADVIGRHFTMFFTAEDIAAGLPERELLLARRTGRAQAEGRRVRKDGQVFWANVTITRVLDADGTLRGFAKVTRDLSEQHRWAELEKSSRRMEEFLATLAHELRNPLAPLRNAVEIMALRNDLPADMADVRRLIGRQTQHLTRLVDDLLDVARITTGRISLVKAWVDVCEVIRSSVESVRPQMDGKHQALELDLPAEPVGILGDTVRLAQAIQNLLTNATRYTPDGGRIRVAGERQGTAFQVTVTDNGIGLLPDASERIFRLFSREPVARHPEDSGLGIGLSLARRIVELHGGNLTANSGGPGQGTTFSMLLPAPAGSAPIALALEARTETSGRRVLVIDDNHDSTDSMVEVLSLLGHDARGAYSGADGLTLAGTFRPDVVLLDLNMPDMSGFDVAKQLRTRFDADLLVVAMTGYGRQADRQATLVTGFDEHLTKPVAFEQLEALLAGVPRRDTK